MNLTIPQPARGGGGSREPGLSAPARPLPLSRPHSHTPPRGLGQPHSLPWAGVSFPKPQTQLNSHRHLGPFSQASCDLPLALGTALPLPQTSRMESGPPERSFPVGPGNAFQFLGPHGSWCHVGAPRPSSGLGRAAYLDRVCSHPASGRGCPQGDMGRRWPEPWSRTLKHGPWTEAAHQHGLHSLA